MPTEIPMEIICAASFWLFCRGLIRFWHMLRISAARPASTGISRWIPPAAEGRCGQVKAQEMRIQVRLPQPHIRMVDDLHQADQQHHLNRHRDHGGEGAVMCFFIQKGLFIGYLVRVTEILDLQPVHRRFQADHFDAVRVHPQGYRQQDHLGHEGKQDHSQAVVARQAVGDPHQPAKRRAD